MRCEHPLVLFRSETVRKYAHFLVYLSRGGSEGVNKTWLTLKAHSVQLPELIFSLFLGV